VLLTDEILEARRPQPLRERRNLACMLVGGVREEVTHGVSMLRAVNGSVADTWSGASYERLAETYAPIHDRVVEALAIEPGARVLDVACGTGGVALRAARAGANVVGIDISADQLVKARSSAGDEGLAIEFDEGDCQELPYDDGEFDAVASAFGAIFAADHEQTARELARVCRPGGRLVLTAWQKDGWSDLHAKAGRTFSLEADAREWSQKERVHALLGDAFELELEEGRWRVEADSGAALWELLSNSMPPLRTWLAEQSDEKRAHAERVYLQFLGPGVLEREYVLVMGIRR
jgi:ubiquinone/menaquinone biosynthesis C-methylase UbiE